MLLLYIATEISTFYIGDAHKVDMGVFIGNVGTKMLCIQYRRFLSSFPIFIYYSLILVRVDRILVLLRSL